jgi:pimeloyl-ACP methyl ester carboxylesterase
MSNNASRPTRRQSLKLATAALAALANVGSGPAAAQPAPRPTAVLVHGAFADGSSWNEIIPLLQAGGLDVVAVQNPLTSLADDVEFARRAIDNAKGPVVLVGHSWGGAVITQAGANERVKALVYVAAFALERNQSIADTVTAYPTPVGIQNPVLDKDGFLTLTPETIAKHFAQDLSPAQTNLIATTQGPIRASNFGEKVSAAAWENKPSWYIVAEQDHMIDPRLQRDFARKIKARTVSLPASHVPMISRSREVANAILEAARNIK